MRIQKLRNNLQVLLLACMLSVSFTHVSMAQTVAKDSQILRDKRPSAKLSVKQLKHRIGILNRVVSNSKIHPKWRQRGLNMRAADKAELKKRSTVRKPRVQKPAKRQAGLQPQILRILRDKRPSSNLPDRQLKQRLTSLRSIINSGDVRTESLRRARAMYTADRTELRKRASVRTKTPQIPPQGRAKSASEAGRVLRDERPAYSLSTRQLKQRVESLQRIIAARQSQPKWHRRALTMRDTDVAELRSRSQGTTPPAVAAVLNDKHPARSLSTKALNRRIRALEGIANASNLDKRQRNMASRMRSRDLRELESRSRANRLPYPRHIDVLQDRRPAVRLTGKELQTRVRAIRAQLQQQDLPRDIRRQLARKLAADRTELRRRIKARRERQEGQGYQLAPPTRSDIALAEKAKRLLSDYRVSSELNKRQLRRRIRSNREVLKYVALTSKQHTALKAMLRLDRMEKRHRLLAARDRRQEKMRRLRSQGQLRFETNPDYANNYPRAPRGDITAAESDKFMIQRQLLRPETRTYNRRYSRAEIIRRPELTRQFAGIDVDTINFGFNEYWIREEEVDELERMAVTIEKILALRPYEVFQIEGHTDAVGSDAYNIGLSQQRAIAVKEALTKFFVISANNLVTVGLGERYLKIPTLEPESENRRVTIRRITPIVRR